MDLNLWLHARNDPAVVEEPHLNLPGRMRAVGPWLKMQRWTDIIKRKTFSPILRTGHYYGRLCGVNFRWHLGSEPVECTYCLQPFKKHLVWSPIGKYRTAQTINDTIKDSYVPLLTGLTFEGDVVQPPRQIPWSLQVSYFAEDYSTHYRYPGGFAWQFDVTKKVLRRSPEFKKFHSFLVFETEVVR